MIVPITPYALQTNSPGGAMQQLIVTDSFVTKSCINVKIWPELSDRYSQIIKQYKQILAYYWTVTVCVVWVHKCIRPRLGLSTVYDN